MMFDLSKMKDPSCPLCQLEGNNAEIVRIGSQEPELRESYMLAHQKHLLRSIEGETNHTNDRSPS